MELKIVEQVYEGVHGDWVYRFICGHRGVLIRRVPNEDKIHLWNHGVISQMFDSATQTFRPSNVCGLAVYFNNLEEAQDIVKKLG
jgi:hypothetical protein